MAKRPSTESHVRSMSGVRPRPVEWLWPGWIPLGKLTVLDGDPGVGKALAIDTALPTPAGWATMGTVCVGDHLFDDRGRACTVMAATEVMHGRPCFRVRFSGGAEVTADAKHLWQTVDHRARRRRWLGEWREHRRGAPARRSGPVPRPEESAVLTTEEIAATLRRSDRRTNYAVPVAAPLELPERSLPIDPYTLGVWLGDGESASNRFSGSDKDRAIFSWVERAGFTVSRHPTTGKTTPNWTVHGLRPLLRSVGLLGNKHVPPDYLRASRAQRLALLQGLMDTDGYARPDGLAEFTNTNHRLADAVAELVASLGWKAVVRSERATLRGRDVGPKYRVAFRPPEPAFRLPRKAAHFRPERRATCGWRYIVACDPVPSVPVRCVQVDSPSQLYLATRSMIPTHNSTLLLDLAARLSRDGVMPDGAAGPLGAALILSAEDGEEDTIRPRLEAAGGVAARLFTLPAVRGDDGEMRPPEIPLDLPAIDAAVKQYGARLLVIDPLMAFLSGADASVDQEVRRALFRLARLAERRDCAVVCLRHLSKVGGDKAVYRGGGSIGIVAAARSGLVAAADPDDPGKRILAAAKCNLAAPPRPLRFALEPCGGVCRVRWLGEADVTADELVRRVTRLELAKRVEERSRLEEAVEFLRRELADGPMPTSQCYLHAQIEGIARRTLQRALKPAGVRQQRAAGGGDPLWELDPGEGSKP